MKMLLRVAFYPWSWKPLTRYLDEFTIFWCKGSLEIESSFLEHGNSVVRTVLRFA